jgi:TrmH family RNA methyltransferase
MPDELARLRPVTSSQNALVKDLRHAFRSAEPDAGGYCAIESVRAIEEAIRSGLRFRAVFFSHSGKARAQKLLPQISTHVETVLLPDPVFAGAVATDSPQGVAALARMPQHDLSDVLDSPEPLIVVAAGVQDPGNLGTIIRSAEAFGAAGALLTEGTVSPFNAKVMRASAGSLFRLPVVRAESAAIVSALRARGIRLLATLAHKGTPLPQADLCGGVALFVGNEGAGLPKALAQQMDETVMIPQSAQVESLNAAIAASIVLYEAARQRNANAETQRRRGE